MKSIEQMVGSSTKELKDSRIKSTLKAFASVSGQEIQAAVVDFRSVRIEFDKLMDMGDDTTMDIAVKIREQNPKEFVSKVNEVASDLVMQARAIDIMVAIHNQLYPDNTVVGLDSNDIEGLEDAIYPKRPE